jgi:hypothetical protein
MDDGQYEKRGGLTLCTDSFTMEEINTLISVLETKFGFICTVHKKVKKIVRTEYYYRIYISTKSLPKLRSLVTKFMHPTMLYKISSSEPKPVGSTVEVLDLHTNQTTLYKSVIEAAANLNCSKSLIRHNQKQMKVKGIQIPLKDRYIIKIVKNS